MPIFLRLETPVEAYIKNAKPVARTVGRWAAGGGLVTSLSRQARAIQLANAQVAQWNAGLHPETALITKNSSNSLGESQG